MKKIKCNSKTKIRKISKYKMPWEEMRHIEKEQNMQKLASQRLQNQGKKNQRGGQNIERKI